MVVQFARWEHSLALRVPSALVREIGAAEGRTAEIVVRDGARVVTPIEQAPRYDLSDLLAGMTDENLHGEVRTGSATGDEFA